MFSVKCRNGAGWQHHWERSYIDSRNPNKKIEYTTLRQLETVVVNIPSYSVHYFKPELLSYKMTEELTL